MLVFLLVLVASFAAVSAETSFVPSLIFFDHFRKHKICQLNAKICIKKTTFFIASICLFSNIPDNNPKTAGINVKTTSAAIGDANMK